MRSWLNGWTVLRNLMHTKLRHGCPRSPSVDIVLLCGATPELEWTVGQHKICNQAARRRCVW